MNGTPCGKLTPRIPLNLSSGSRPTWTWCSTSWILPVSHKLNKPMKNTSSLCSQIYMFRKIYCIVISWAIENFYYNWNDMLWNRENFNLALRLQLVNHFYVFADTFRHQLSQSSKQRECIRLMHRWNSHGSKRFSCSRCQANKCNFSPHFFWHFW